LPQYISLSVSPVCGEIAAGLHYALPASLKNFVAAFTSDPRWRRLSSRGFGNQNHDSHCDSRLM